MSSTLVPDFPDFPFLEPPAPQSHAIPLPKRRRTRLTEHRNLYHETADLSEEEEEVEDVVSYALIYARLRGQFLKAWGNLVTFHQGSRVRVLYTPRKDFYRTGGAG